LILSGVSLMQRCPACDHFNLADATECERCGRTLSSESPDEAASSASSGLTADTFESRVLHTARTSGKIAAIKLYREQRGGGLKEAKEAVEAMMAEHGVTTGAGAGCGATVLALFVLLLAALRLIAT
jgi:hypothetical protein